LGRVVSQGELILQRREWKRNGKRVVFASGVFDLLHPGHIRLLEQARAQGDILVVGIPSDASVRAAFAAMNTAAGDPRRASGSGRPITTATERAEILAALAAVDFVTEFDDASPQALLAALAPEIQVKGGGKSKDSVAQKEDAAAEAAGIQTKYVPLEPGFSTTSLLQRIQQLRA
jgi:rfaE bifunctional protein nucleotidyltransferase chain/domain